MIKRLSTALEALVAIIFLAQLGDSLPRSSTEPSTAQIQRRRGDDYVSSHRIPLSQDPSTQWPLSYFGEVTIGGQPGKDALKVRTRFDTSTGSQFVVPGNKCDPSNGCAGEASGKYDGSGRPGLKAVDTPLVRSNLVSSFVGDVYEDKVELGGFTVDNMKFLSAAKANSAPLYDKSTAAIMGFGMPIESPEDDSYMPSFFQELVENREVRAVGRNEVSFFFGRPSADTQDLSEMLFGRRNPELFVGQEYPMDVATSHDFDPLMWALSVTGTTMDGTPIRQARAGLAVIDTGSPLISLPIDMAETLFDRIPGSFNVLIHATSNPPVDETYASIDPSLATWAFPCTADLPRLAFTLGDDSFDSVFGMNPEDFKLGEIEVDDGSVIDMPGAKSLADARRSGTQLCLSSVVGKEPSAGGTPPLEFSLGTSFLRSWYSTFSLAKPASITLARAVEHRPDDGAGQVEVS